MRCSTVVACLANAFRTFSAIRVSVRRKKLPRHLRKGLLLLKRPGRPRRAKAFLRFQFPRHGGHETTRTYLFLFPLFRFLVAVPVFRLLSAPAANFRSSPERLISFRGCRVMGSEAFSAIPVSFLDRRFSFRPSLFPCSCSRCR